CQFEEDLPQAGVALLGLSARSGSRSGAYLAPGRVDSPESPAEQRSRRPSRARYLKRAASTFQIPEKLPDALRWGCAPTMPPLNSELLRSYAAPTLPRGPRGGRVAEWLSGHRT